MAKVGHTANRLTPEQRAKFQAWLDGLRFPDGPGGRKVSQQAIADRTGVQQSFIHNLLSKNVDTTVGTARAMMLAAGADPKSVLGTEGAPGKFEGRDHMVNRGQVLDALSAFYDEEFLSTCQSLTPPPGSERWTHHRWNRYVVEMRELWESGHLRPKKLPRTKK